MQIIKYIDKDDREHRVYFVSKSGNTFSLSHHPDGKPIFTVRKSKIKSFDIKEKRTMMLE